MINRALIIVPHPDDEINLAGGIFDTLHDNGIYTIVMMCTNGDYIPENAAKRYYEAKKTQRVLKYHELIFLGYGDGYSGRHIFDIDNEVAVSHCGKTETYCAGNTHEYCYSSTGVHHSYTRDNYKKDIQSVIVEKRAELIICVDLDNHSDHRCVSLLFDECMGEVLKSEPSYRPWILKGFAYHGVWFGPKDFFDLIIKPTTLKNKPDDNIARNCFPYNWEDRIRIKNSDRALTLKLWKNTVFKALLANRTQSDCYLLGYCALSRFPRIANPDTCYWYRNPFNIALYSKIESTSGDVGYLNDFKLASPQESIEDDMAIESVGWAPDPNDKEPVITMTFPRTVSLSRVIVYQNFNSSIDRIGILLDHGFKMEYQCPESTVLKIIIPSILTNRLSLQIYSTNSNLTINEIECYEQDYEFPWSEIPLTKYCHHTMRRNLIATFLSKSCYKIMIIGVLLYSKIKAELNKGNS